jgi:hypothetical protein
MHARNEGIELMFIHALTENRAMLNIARKAGAVLERDGSETEAHLRLPRATIDSRMTAMVEEQFAQTDYHLKSQAKQFWGVLGAIQEIRQACVTRATSRAHERLYLAKRAFPLS